MNEPWQKYQSKEPWKKYGNTQLSNDWTNAPIADSQGFQLQSSARRVNHGFIDEAVHGLSMGTADEINAAVMAPIRAYSEGRSIGNAYDTQLSDYRDAQKEYRRNNQGKAIVANLSGALVPGLGVGAKAVQRFGPYVGSAITGGAAGATFGFADSEGGIENRAKGALVGGALGSVTGPLIAAALKGGKTALSKIGNVLGVTNSDEVTVTRILKAMQDDGLTPKEIGETLDAWAASGKPMALADMGENVRGLGAYVSKQPGPGRTFAIEKLMQRQAGQADRVIGDIKTFVSSDDLYTKVDDLVDARRMAATPHYEAAYKKNFVWSDKLEELLSRKPVQGALKNAEYLMMAEGKDPKALGFKFNEAGDVKFIATPSMEALDYIKRGMDDVVEGYRDKTTGKLALDGRGRAFNNLLGEYRRELVKLNPSYGEALKAFAGPSQSIDIIQRGQNFLKRDAEIIAKDIATMSKDDLEMYKIGVAKSLYDEVTKRVHGADKAKFLISSPRKEKALEVIFGGKDKFSEFKSRLMAETEMHKTYGRTTGGSPTQPLQAEEQAMKQGASLVEDVLRGNPTEAVFRSGRMALDRLHGVNDKARESISHILFENDPQELAKYLEFLAKRNASRSPNSRLMSRQKNRIFGGGASSAGSAAGLYGANNSN